MRFLNRFFNRNGRNTFNNNFGTVIELTVKEAAARLGIQPATVRQQIGRGRLHASKRGRDWFVTPAEIDRYRREVQD